MHYIGIDIGTSSIAGVVLDSADKTIEIISRENDTEIESSETWEKLQNPSKILSYILEILDEILIKYNDLGGIGITGQMHGILYVDDKGDSVSPLYTWQDERGNLKYDGNSSYADYLKRETGCNVSSGFGLVTHFYNLKNNIVPKDASKLCTIMDYVVMKLTGSNVPFIDNTLAASLGFFDLINNEFLIGAMKKAGINSSILPDVCESVSYIGNYKSNIPVFSAIGDNQASFKGSVDDIEGSVHVTIGTSSQISVFSEKYIEIDNIDVRPFPGGGYILVGAALCGGSSLKVLKLFYNKTLKFFNVDINSELNIYEKLNSLNYTETSQEDLIVNTLFDGSRNNPLKRGSILNISMNNLTPENLTLGFMKGIANELLDFYNILPDHLKQNKSILVGSGNAIKKNELLCTVLENLFNLKLKLSLTGEEAALGVCYSIMRGVSR